MADQFIGGFDPATAAGKPTSAEVVVAGAPALPSEKDTEGADGLLSLGRAGRHPQQSPAHRAEFIQAQPRQCRLGPLLGLQRAFPVLRTGRVVDVRRTVVVVEDLFPLVKMATQYVPDPVRPIR